MAEMEPHTFMPDHEGLCTYTNAELERCGKAAVRHLMSPAEEAAMEADKILGPPVKPARYRNQERIGGPTGPKVCAECDNGLFKLDLRNGLIVLTCSGCDEETEVPWGVLRGHLKEPE